MARNEEKAQAMLNRWWKMKRQLTTKPLENRPLFSTEVNSISECEKWREQIIREITKKVTLIQNAGLGEHRIRDLNDEINKLLREKYHWENRIRELGGLDYRKFNPKMVDAQGIELPGSGGYKYFGAAKDLPGVRELFQREIPTAPNKHKSDLFKNITYNYYGFLGEEDREMREEEKRVEEEERRAEVSRWVLENRGKETVQIKDFEKLEEDGEVEDEANWEEEEEVEEVEGKEKTEENEAKREKLERRRKELLAKVEELLGDKNVDDNAEEKHIKELIEMNEDV